MGINFAGAALVRSHQPLKAFPCSLAALIGVFFNIFLGARIKQDLGKSRWENVVGYCRGGGVDNVHSGQKCS